MSSIREALERLTLASAVRKLAERETRTGDPGNARGAVDAYLMGMREQVGLKSIDLMLGGEKVGTVTLAESRERVSVYVDDAERAMDYLADNRDLLRRLLLASTKELGEIARETGEVPDGCSAHVEPARVTHTVVKVDEGKAMAAARGLPGGELGLLEGMVDDG